MTVYVVTYHTRDSGCQIEWFATKAAREAAYRKYVKLAEESDVHAGNSPDEEYEDQVTGPIEKRSHDITLTREGLVAWLNTHFTSDNG